jgi:hypothetical protein
VCPGALPREHPDAEVLHCGWTDPRDRVNWHVRSFRDPAGVAMIAFRRATESAELATINRFEIPCDRLEDHQIAMLLDQAKKGGGSG